MSAIDALRRLAAGERPGDRLLGACRMMWAGAEAFGEEAILEDFRAAPLDCAAFDAVETAHGAALAGADVALAADLYDGRIGRIWRVGAGAPAPEPAVSVAFDPDLRQERGGVYMRAEDLPELAEDARAGILRAGHALLAQSDTPLHRARAFVVRGFGDAARSAALFGHYCMTGGDVRRAGFAHAVALLEGADMRLVRDPVPDRPWTPRLRIELRA